MKLKTLSDFKNKYSNQKVNIFLRCDLNITENDLSRIEMSIPTIKKLLSYNFVNKIVICSHLGRPKSREVDLSLNNKVHKYLEMKLEREISFIDYKENLNFSEFFSSKDKIFLLENIRFFDGELNNSKLLSRALSSMCDVFINDAFGASHRKHSSVYGVSFLMDSYAGELMLKELSTITKINSTSSGKSVLIIGGAKIEDKSGILVNLIEKVDKIIIGGGMIANFLTKNLDKKLKEIYHTNKEKFYIPEDLLVSKNFSENSEKNIIHVSDYNDSLKIVDIGFKSIKSISELLKNIEIAIWNGSMGVFEWEQCSMGTKSLINLLKENNIKTYAGGGSTIEAINKFDHKSSFEHVSSGGGAFLELLEKETLPGIENLYETR